MVSLTNMDIVIKDANASATANVKLLNMVKKYTFSFRDYGYVRRFRNRVSLFLLKIMQIEYKVILSSKLIVEGPLRMKEEYLEGMLESPTVIEEAVPEQLRGLLAQAATTMKQLPDPIKDTLASGLRIPLGKPLS